MSGANAELNDSELLAELERDMAACKELVPKAPHAPAADARELALERLESERGVAARLRSLPGPWRWLLVAAVASATTAASLSMTPRPDLELYPSGRMAVVLVALFALTAAACWRLLRPIHRPPLSPAVDYAMLIVSAALPTIVAVSPMDHVGAPAGDGAAFIIACTKCMSFGAVFGLPVMLLAVAARRANVGGPAVAALAGVAAGLTGNLVLQVHCPITEPGHVLLGHAAMLAPLGLVAAVWQTAKTRAKT
jgi:hypothetical protein